ncbi:TetR/AcrR family transcriptional regulator [Paenibacillus xylanilyticus]|uniref:TetR/AcrR family transcriptional regulator n=1 Tax=Paenibacillus xylanilyticus TaxID=248903 RepID=A0A7Y6C024_9BACL|nr:TetR/AcrR family transcriptional regulator [Paenibacillus xylanilyticus]NUU78045.1 TetR/AcrR family transcriptional regulator [Paenibacillus xylanilyticus]
MSEIPNSMDRRIKKSKAALKDALIHLMQKHAFKEISITDIVQRADLNRGTFYRHYQYKEDLFNEIIDDVIQDLVTSFRKPYQGMKEFEVGLMPSSAITIFEHVHQHAQFYTLVVKSEASSNFQRMICDVLRDLSLQDLNHIFPQHINPELLASYQSHAIFGMILEWIRQDFKHSPVYMAEELFKIIHYRPDNVLLKEN